METANNQSCPNIDAVPQYDESNDPSVLSYMDNKSSETGVLCHILVSHASGG